MKQLSDLRVADILAVAHHQFKAMSLASIRALGKPAHVFHDPKYLLTTAQSDIRL